jgi:hypothetical protein
LLLRVGLGLYAEWQSHTGGGQAGDCCGGL